MSWGHGLLDPLRSDPGSAGLFVDFDGTLSEIAVTPELARPVAEVPTVLADLALRFAVVAVVTGRERADAERLLAVPGVRVFGLYGAEDGNVVLQPVPADLRHAVSAAAAQAPGARIEDKGSSIAVHLRNAIEREDAAARLEPLLRNAVEAYGYIVVRGRMVLEVAPSAMGDKGGPVRAAAATQQLRSVLYAGDDLSDLAAFAALDELRARGVHTVKVAVASAEGPSELVANADLIVHGPAGFLKVLRSLRSSQAPPSG
jgi:trehalose 6-phosphate phosphatase